MTKTNPLASPFAFGGVCQEPHAFRAGLRCTDANAWKDAQDVYARDARATRDYRIKVIAKTALISAAIAAAGGLGMYLAGHNFALALASRGVLTLAISVGSGVIAYAYIHYRVPEFSPKTVNALLKTLREAKQYSDLPRYSAGAGNTLSRWGIINPSTPYRLEDRLNEYWELKNEVESVKRQPNVAKALKENNPLALPAAYTMPEAKLKQLEAEFSDFMEKFKEGLATDWVVE